MCFDVYAGYGCSKKQPLARAQSVSLPHPESSHLLPFLVL